MKKKLFTLCFTLLCAANFSAFATIIDGISYKLDSSIKTASVIAPESGVSYINAVIIPESVIHGGVTYRVTSIGSSAFKNCTGLTSVTIPNSVTAISAYAFSGCTNLTATTLFEGILSIGQEAFYNCSALTSVTIPNSTTAIGNEAFYACSSITSITIPENVSSIGNHVFERCTNLTTVVWNAKRTNDGGYYVGSKHYCYYSPFGTTTNSNYSETVPNITEFIFGESVKVIPENLCAGMKQLQTIFIPNSVDSIKSSAFYKCENLQTVEIGSSIKYLYYPFGNCSKILDFSIWAKTPPVGLPSIDTAVTITIPCGSENLYKAANVWKNYNFQESIGYTFSAKTADPLMGAVDVTQFPDCSTNGIAKFVATPEDGYHFVSWNDGSTTNPRTVEVTEDLAFVATFAQDVKVTSLSLDKSTLTIQPGESYTLVPTISPADATNQNIHWTSSNADIAYVYNGTVTGLSNGRAVITAETEDGHFTASCIVTVADPISVTGITLSETSINMQIGDTHQLTATVLPADAANKNYTWKTDDATIATVENGLITAVNYGKTTITATTEDGGKTATCEVEVGVPVAGITLDQTEIIIAPGASKKLTATVEPENATNKTLTWTSSDENVAAVANGWVIGVAEGTATITATTEDGGFVATCQVTVGIPVTGITLNETSLVLMPGNTKQLLVTIEPANASNQNYTLTSDNEDVALITSAGWLVANNVGTANITATSEDGGYTATCIVTVQTTISTAIEYQDGQDISVHKVLENGTIYIIRNGEKYTIDGRKIM